MEYTKKEKATAQHIIENADIRNLLEKVFTKRAESFNAQLVAEKTNEELGEIVRADSIAEQKIAIRWAEIVRLGQEESTGTAKDIAPE